MPVTWRVTFMVAALCAAGTAALADEEFTRLDFEYMQAQQQWVEKARAARAEEGGKSPARSKPPPHPAAEFLPRYRAYAEAHPGSVESMTALARIVGMARAGRIDFTPGKDMTNPDAVAALARLRQDYAGHTAIGDILPELRFSRPFLGRGKLEAFYDEVAAKNKDREVVALAKLCSAECAYEAGRYGDMGDLEPDKAASARAAALFRGITKDYGDTEAAKQAAPYVFELDHLQIGMKAPEIVGQDAEGKEIRTSQFRGQVVVLDFWGFW